MAIDKNVLTTSGLFDPAFSLYGWEDLELGERLRQMGTELIKCPKAIGYHWHPALSIDQIPSLVRVEIERAKIAIIFYRKHPTIRVRFIIQLTLIHRIIWEVLTLGGLFNEVTKYSTAFRNINTPKGYETSLAGNDIISMGNIAPLDGHPGIGYQDRKDLIESSSEKVISLN